MPRQNCLQYDTMYCRAVRRRKRRDERKKNDRFVSNRLSLLLYFAKKTALEGAAMEGVLIRHRSSFGREDMRIYLEPACRSEWGFA